MKVYQPLNQKDSSTGLWYKEWNLPEGFPLPNDVTLLAPDSTLVHPKWDNSLGAWVEDEDFIAILIERNEKLSADLKIATDRVDMTESALLNLADMILTK